MPKHGQNGNRFTNGRRSRVTVRRIRFCRPKMNLQISRLGILETLMPACRRNPKCLPVNMRGLALQAELGVNPYKFGASAATDTHTGLSALAEGNFFGKHTAYEPSGERAAHIGENIL